MRIHEDKFFLFLVVAASLAFGLILRSFYSALLWGVVIAILFAPLYRGLLKRTGNRSNLAAIATVTIIVLIVILPISMVGAALAQEAGGMYKKIQSGELDLAQLFQQIQAALPIWISDLSSQFGIANLGGLQERLSAGLLKGSQFLAGQAINIGQSTFDFVVNLFVMVYLLFFLLRDGDALARRIRNALPLSRQRQDELLEKFTVVIRATVKGNMLIALLQGALGGLIFWVLDINGALLWAVVMAFLSLLPAIGAGLVWIPVALYLLATGAVWKGVILIAFGALVIGLVDNLLRPVLVGKDTRMPDYVVLISTLGGIEVFGLNGFVIGPVIAAMFIAVWDIYATSRRDEEGIRDAA
ncbi:MULTISPECIES: AI-2E family transporter [Rhodopseudomonas]|uniref:Membrane protein n=1 Tax=Rhodopseudomonas palustris TaxID=1076 RepID=A0A0D7F8G7_RHOPL|nr:MULTISPECIES: AI-2E family transporter [Rhodopseudomonas]KIZ48012.1 membrane protein [Rhodopseudomonas palustris]MDF3813570.1 AI-2E family transporter [Rhodopseudomonas sp. BAL398]WOK16558.1 AI-2E family transporter [Rhodopseudomonas sp. BAL398]